MSVKHLTRTLGLALVVVVALAAVASSAAFASEFKAAAGANPAGITFTGKGGKATFETAGKATVTCENSESTGEVKGPLEAEVKITYLGKCTLAGAALGNGACTNVAGKEEIKTNALKIEPGTEVGNKKVRLLDVSAKAAGGALANFECQGGVKIEVLKSVICENTKPTLGLKTSIACEKKAGGAAGEQKFVKMERDTGVIVENFLEAEAKVGFIKLREKDSQTTTEEVTFNKEIEQIE